MIELNSQTIKAGINHQQENTVRLISRACGEHDLKALNQHSQNFAALIEANKQIEHMGVSVVIPNMSADEFKSIIDRARYLWGESDSASVDGSTPFDVLL